MRYYAEERDKIDYFREEYFFLSNFYPAKLIFDGIAYPSSEAAYQAQKAADPPVRAAFAELFPDEAKDLGQAVPVRPHWNDIRLGVMRKIVYAKFTQNPHLAKRLTDTGEKPLIEGNTWGDLYWGADLATGEGENHLGKILTELRESFAENGIPAPDATPEYARQGPFGRICVTDADITLSDCACIVSDADKTLLGGGGEDGAIHRAAGPELREECMTLGGCAAGDAKITKGYLLPAGYVIHTVGPGYPCEEREALLRSCYFRSLDLAEENRIRSIAFPVICAGRPGYPVIETCRAAVSAVRGWLAAAPDRDMRVVFSCPARSIYEALLDELQA